jgi:hypothetical protein
MKYHYNQEYSLKAIHKINPKGLFIACSEDYFCLFPHRVASQPYAMLFIAFGEQLISSWTHAPTYSQTLPPHSIVLKFRRNRLSPRIGISKLSVISYQ